MTTSLPSGQADDVEKHPGALGGANAIGENSSGSGLDETRTKGIEASEPDADDLASRDDAEPTSMAGRVLSRMTSKSSVMPGPPPDGGFAAWMVVLASHLVVMNTWGVINSFGAFQSHYATTLNRPPSDISWIGSFEIFLLFFVGTFSGRSTDAGYFRPVVITGSILVVVGSFTTSVCDRYWQFFLAQGVCMGLGNGFLFCPCVALLSTYFQRKRSLAIGIAACGSATGGMVYPSMVRALLPGVGFGWTMRAIGFIQVGTLAFAIVFLKPRIKPRKTGSLVEWAAFKELEYVFYAGGSFLCFWGVYFAFFFLASYARDVQGMSYTTSLNLLLVLNGVGIIGRLVPNHLADRAGTLNMFIPMSAISGLLMYAWAAVDSPGGLYGWAAVYGASAGGIQSLFPAALSSLTTDLRKAGTRMGMVFTIVSFAVLTGPPIAGAILNAADGDYLGAQMFSGSALIAGTGFLAVAREVKRRKIGKEIWVKV